MVFDVTLNDREICDLEMLLNGAFSPLTTYLGEADYFSCVDKMRLTTGEVWPIPIVLAVPRMALDTRGVINLRNQTNAILATIDVAEVFEPDLRREMESVLGTTDPKHPYVEYMSRFKHCVYVTGRLEGAVGAHFHFDFLKYRRSPAEVAGSGRRGTVGFQTRNPIHRSHFELMLAAVKETGCKRLLLSPTSGPTQSGDIPLVTRVKCYEAVLSEFPPDIEVELVLLPLAMRMAGPREAVWHALIRKNYGCTFFVVGRDHAGPSTRNSLGESFYGPYEAQELLAGVAAEAGIRPYFAKNVVYCGKELGYLQEDQAPQDAPRYHISGTKLREMLASGAAVPAWFSFPEVLKTLRQTYNNRGFCVYITGLPCSGKSTMALYLQAQMQEASSRPITVLDADIIRQHLSKGLGFSREDRSDNVRRIGYVASEIVKHGGICLVANIAPYSQDRAFNRRLISERGAYIEVYLSTPLEVCETRDVKLFYKRARDGKIPNFTGVTGPYEAPLDADVSVDSSSHLAENAQAVMDLLRTRGLF